MTTAVLMTPPYLQFVDQNGIPYAGGSVYTYAAGTTTPQATYTDASGGTPLANPVPLDAAGRATIWLIGSYKFVVKNSAGVTISTTDNVTAFGTGGLSTLGTIAANTIIGNNTGSPTTPLALTVTQTLALLGVGSPTRNSLAGDVALNNVANFFDGPTIAQGTTGTWFVSASITVRDTAGAATFIAQLTDGTTVIDSTVVDSSAANKYATLTLSGYIAAPAGNIKVSVKDTTSTSGVILFNASALSKDSTLTAFRIA